METRLPVHPRTRGERDSKVEKTFSLNGSSPHTRGTRLAKDSNSFGRRFIPAHAGNADVTINKHKAITVHPRTRGERSVRP